MADLNWTDEQRRSINEAIAAEIESSRLAHKLIPEYKLSPSDRTVAIDRYDYATDTINENHQNLREEMEPFFLTKLQTEDTDLARALTRVRRAAQQLALNHDCIVFTSIRDEINANAGAPGFHAVVPIDPPYSDGLVSSVSTAVAMLDGQGYRTGYVMVAGQGVYAQLHTRAPGSVDLPIIAVRGLLEDGPVHRSAVLPKDEALLLSISGKEIDRAIAVEPNLEFLRIGAGENREFRLYERFLPRFKQTYAAALLRLNPGKKAAAAP